MCEVSEEMLDDLFALSAVADVQRETLLLLAFGYVSREEALRQAASCAGVFDRVLEKWERNFQAKN